MYDRSQLGLPASGCQPARQEQTAQVIEDELGWLFLCGATYRGAPRGMRTPTEEAPRSLPCNELRCARPHQPITPMHAAYITLTLVWPRMDDLSVFGSGKPTRSEGGGMQTGTPDKRAQKQGKIDRNSVLNTAGESTLL